MELQKRVLAWLVYLRTTLFVILFRTFSHNNKFTFGSVSINYYICGRK